MCKLKKIAAIMLTLILVVSFQACAKDNPVQSKGLANFSEKGVNSVGVQKIALIVGVSDYAGERNDLSGIELDVDQMKRLFQSWGFNVKVLYNHDAMKLVDLLDDYGNQLSTQDFFAFYYSGHGSHEKDQEHGDETEDGNDETLVLSDGGVNTNLIDDILFAKFNNIKAKKMIFFDSCHSGTVFRSLSGKAQAKTMRPEDVTESVPVSRGLSVSKGDTLNKNNGDYVVFSSSQDDEESLATPTGSLFTRSLYEIFTSENGQNKSFEEVNQILTSKVLNYAKETDGKPHHPNINFSSASLGNSSLKGYINTKSIEAPSQPMVTTPTLMSSTQLATQTADTLQNTLEDLIQSHKLKTMSLNYSRPSYNTGESVQFDLDTQGERGYLSIFYVDGNDVTVLYPNPFVSTTPIDGRYSFPKDLSNGKFDLEAYKSCHGCQEEKTTIYVLLSDEPISNINQIQIKELLSFSKNSEQSKVVSRAVRVKATSKNSDAFIPHLSKYEFVVK